MSDLSVEEKSRPRLRFVLLFHRVSDSFIDQQDRGSHWDLLLEHENQLASWAIDENPFDNESRPVVAIKIHPHRMEYLEYEGPVSNDRGSVTRHERGVFRWLTNGRNEVVLDIQGERAKGIIRMERVAGDAWHVTFERSG